LFQAPSGRRDVQLKLYYAPGACSLAPHVALEEAGATFETVRIDLSANEQCSAEYLIINPRGRVPTLMVDGEAVTENIAILTCISRLFPEANLLPSETPIGAARAYDLMSWLGSTVQVSVSQIFRSGRFTSDEATKAVLQRDGRENVVRHYQVIEQALTGAWALGDGYSLLDPYLLVFWRWGERLGLDMDQHARWASHTARMLARPAVARAMARETPTTST
jgi:glutathione S-transferase